MNNQEEYIQQLEQVINKFLEPLKGIPFSVAIKALTGFEVLAFELSDERNKKLLEQLMEAKEELQAELIRRVTEILKLRDYLKILKEME